MATPALLTYKMSSSWITVDSQTYKANEYRKRGFKKKHYKKNLATRRRCFEAFDEINKYGPGHNKIRKNKLGI